MHPQVRRTKIIATLGPATDAPGMLKQIIAEGVDVVRLNLSHGTADDHHRRAQEARAAAAELGREIAVLADLQGPKIRIEKFLAGPVILKPGAPFAQHSRQLVFAGGEPGIGQVQANHLDVPDAQRLQGRGRLRDPRPRHPGRVGAGMGRLAVGHRGHH